MAEAVAVNIPFNDQVVAVIDEGVGYHLDFKRNRLAGEGVERRPGHEHLGRRSARDLVDDLVLELIHWQAPE